MAAPESPLRTLAHPLRSRLLAHLRVHGEATATTLAAALGTHTGATSYHLRRLAEAGLVYDTGHGDGKRRVWAAVPEGVPEQTPLDEDDEAAARWLQLDYVEHFAQRATAWVGQQGEWPDSWQADCGLRDHPVLVTDEQATALVAELAEVLTRYRRAGAGTPGARRVAAYTALLPIDPPPTR